MMKTVWRRPALCRAWQWNGVNDREYSGPAVSPTTPMINDPAFYASVMHEASRVKLDPIHIGVLILYTPSEIGEQDVSDGYILLAPTDWVIQEIDSEELRVVTHAHYQALFDEELVPTPPLNGCRKAPQGWLCQREEGHAGPCAAAPFWTGELSTIQDSDGVDIDRVYLKRGPNGNPV